VFKAASLIVILAVFSGLAMSFARPAPFPAAGARGAAWERFSDFGRLDELMRDPAVVLLDARIRESYALGRIPGARSLPADLAASGDPQAMRELRSLPRDAPVVAYCSEPLCPLAERLAGILAAEGFRRVSVFAPGFDGYLDSGRPVEEAPDGF
jgi:rhodanese-related sulfurtransferase